MDSPQPPFVFEPQEILEAVAKNGVCVTMMAGLLNMSHFSSVAGGRSFKEKMDEFCTENRLNCRTFDAKNPHGKKIQFIRFWR